MDPADFTMPSGRLVPTILDQRAFVPNALPPSLELAPIQHLLSEADQKLGELRGIGRYLPNPYLLIRPLQRREAIASSNIEGTYTSLPELLMFESGIEDQPRAVDTREVFNYINALQEGFRLLEQVPISNRLINALHKRLLLGMPKHRSGVFAPGEYRTEQNLIGKSKDISKSRFNPPPPPIHLDCMSGLEKFVNSEDMGNIPTLIFLAMIHYQFETIHPFPDGNGRVGRLLIPIILKSRGVMDQPLLYMSQFFEDNRDEYVELLLKVSQRSDWLSWIAFFLRGVIEASEKTIQTIHNVMELQETYKQRCQQARSSALLMQIIDSLFERIGITVPVVRDMTGTSYTAALNNLNKLVEYGILQEHKGPQRPKFYFATELVKIFES
jgi:Fic family protein